MDFRDDYFNFAERFMKRDTQTWDEAFAKVFRFAFGLYTAGKSKNTEDLKEFITKLIEEKK